MDYVLAVNAGSSSIKAALYEIDQVPIREVTTYTASNLSLTSAELHIVHNGEDTHQPLQGDREAVVAQFVDKMRQTIPGKVAGIGHRIVHGGSTYAEPVRITDTVIAGLASLQAYDPEHTPAALQLFREMRKLWPDVPQIACFDTAFFRDMPTRATIVPLPRKFRKLGVRRYGFHGLSYTSLMQQITAQFGTEVANGRIILAHLGSGASLAAVHHGKPVDTTMSFTPASGIMMSSRSGDLDPSIGLYLEQQAGISSQAFNDLINKQSGLLGVSGISADMYTLVQQEQTNPHAAEAVDLFCYQVRKAIGSLSAAMSGLDTLVFSGGIGEQSVPLRQRICDGFEYLGVQLDVDRNAVAAPTISADGSRVGVHIIPTNETYVIADIVANYKEN